MPQRGVHQGMVPVLIQKIQERNVAYDKDHHGDEFLSRLKHHGFQLTVDHPHITELADNRRQGGFQAAVVLAGNEGVAPFLKHRVVNSHFHIMERRRHIGVHQPDAGHKGLKYGQNGRIQVWEIFLHRRQNVLVSEVGRGDDTERRFQLRRNVLFEVAGRELHPPERQEHTARRHDRNQKKVREHHGHGRAHGKEQQGQGTEHGKACRSAGDLEDRLHLGKLPAQIGFLFPADGFIDLIPEGFGLISQPAEDGGCKRHGCQPKQNKRACNHSNAGD